MTKAENKETYTNKQEYLWTGIILIIVTIGVLHFYYTPTDKYDISTINQACNAKINLLGQEINVGSFGQKLLGEEDTCRSMYYHSMVIQYGWWGYVLGVILIVASFIMKEKTYSY